MKVQNIAENSLEAFCNTFDLHYVVISLENQFLVFFLSGRLRQVSLYNQPCWLKTCLLHLLFISISATLDKQDFLHTPVNIFLPIAFNICSGAEKNRLIETVLLSTHNICFC